MPMPLQRLLRPRSIAIVGASPDRMSPGNNALANLDRAGYAGALHLVSRTRSQIDGRTCLKSIDDLPDGVDAVILIVPAQAVRDAVEACVRRNVGGALVFAAGFGETGDAGRREQRAIAEVARAGNLALLGPNCIGLVNLADRIPLTFEPVELKPVELKPVAGPGVCAVAQSGGMAGNLRMALAAKGVPVAFAVSTGNEAVLSATDIGLALVDSPDVALFAFFVEQIVAPQQFLDLAERARAAGKPVVLLHSGKSTRAAQAAQSHTGALAGNWAIMKAFAAHAGVVVVETPDELFDTVSLLARYPHPPDKPLAVSTNSGAIRGFALDLAEDIGLSYAGLSEATAARLREVLPDFATIDNPLDLTAQTMQKPSLFGHSAAAMLADPQVGGVIVAAMGGGPGQQLAKWTALKPALIGASKPVAYVVMGDGAPLDAATQSDIDASGVPFFRSPERALRAFKHVADYGRMLATAQEPKQDIPVIPVGIDTTGTIAEHRGKLVLSNAGIAVPNGRLARTLEEAQAVAAQIGYPVALKAQADALAHKSDAGGVAIGIAGVAELRAAFARIAKSVSSVMPDLRLDGVLVEAMARKGGLELIVGARRDPAWGPVLMAGLGGVWTEAMGDVRLIPAGASPARIEAELRALKAARLLGPFRGAPARDVAAVARTLATLGALMLASPRLAEIEINPLIVYGEGEGVLALDALLVMAP